MNDRVLYCVIIITINTQTLTKMEQREVDNDSSDQLYLFSIEDQAGEPIQVTGASYSLISKQTYKATQPEGA